MMYKVIVQYSHAYVHIPNDVALLTYKVDACENI